MVLMKLRMNLCDKDLAFRFGVSQSAVSKNFWKWIDLMYVHLYSTIQRSSHEAVVKTMPFEVRKAFKKCICIIDCFEISVSIQLILWLESKHFQTISITIQSNT